MNSFFIYNFIYKNAIYLKFYENAIVYRLHLLYNKNEIVLVGCYIFIIYSKFCNEEQIFTNLSDF